MFNFNGNKHILKNILCLFLISFIAISQEKYDKNEVIPTITEDTIKMAQKSILEKSSGPKQKGNNLVLFNEFNKTAFKTNCACKEKYYR